MHAYASTHRSFEHAQYMCTHKKCIRAHTIHMPTCVGTHVHAMTRKQIHVYISTYVKTRIYRGAHMRTQNVTN